MKHQLGKDYSFTDCMMITVMKEQGLKRVLTKDEHFKIAGFDALLI
jgi:predicted nucleic acid-binding protein